MKSPPPKSPPAKFTNPLRSPPDVATGLVGSRGASLGRCRVPGATNVFVVYSTEVSSDEVAGTLDPAIEDDLHGVKAHCESRS